MLILWITFQSYPHYTQVYPQFSTAGCGIPHVRLSAFTHWRIIWQANSFSRSHQRCLSNLDEYVS